MDILAVVLPQVPSFAGLCVFLVSLGVFDLPQVGPVLDGVRPLDLLKDNLNRLFSGPSRRVRLDIDALILLARRNKGRVNGRVEDHFCLIPFRSVCRRAFRPGIRGSASRIAAVLSTGRHTQYKGRAENCRNQYFAQSIVLSHPVPVLSGL